MVHQELQGQVVWMVHQELQGQVVWMVLAL
jgi:hypothetical protein